MHSQPLPSRRWRTWLAPVALLTSTLLVAACGGGGGSGDAGGPAVSAPLSYATGRIAGFGSVIVNGVRYDDSSASVGDDDGNDRRSDTLELGMVVEITGGAIDDSVGGVHATASQIVVRSEIKGPVEAVDAGAGTLTVLGQPLVVDAATVFEDSRGLSDIASGALVEVYALVEAGTGRLLATRIEIKTALERYKLRGTVSALDETAQTFRIGGALISYAGIAASERPALRDGLSVKVKLATTAVGGAWVATELRSGERKVEDRNEAELEGLVSDFVSLASFKVAGVPVDASGAAVRFERLVASAIADGVQVEVEGTIRDGVLIATKVKREDANDDDGEVELHGAIESLDAGAGTLTVRGVSVQWDETTVFDGGNATNLAVGARVEVKGRLAANGTTVQADEIDFED